MCDKPSFVSADTCSRACARARDMTVCVCVCVGGFLIECVRCVCAYARKLSSRMSCDTFGDQRTGAHTHIRRRHTHKHDGVFAVSTDGRPVGSGPPDELAKNGKHVSVCTRPQRVPDGNAITCPPPAADGDDEMRVKRVVLKGCC